MKGWVVYGQNKTGTECAGYVRLNRSGDLLHPEVRFALSEAEAAGGAQSAVAGPDRYAGGVPNIDQNVPHV